MLIAASNAPLDEEVAAGRFRADLYFRINVVGFYLPPLRDRRASVAPLAQKFLAELAGRIACDRHHTKREFRHPDELSRPRFEPVRRSSRPTIDRG